MSKGLRSPSGVKKLTSLVFLSRKVPSACWAAVVG